MFREFFLTAEITAGIAVEYHDVLVTGGKSDPALPKVLGSGLTQTTAHCFARAKC